jgi:class 3 adenylate cyclase
VIVLLAAGLVNMVGASLTVGFEAGPAVFLVTAAIGAVLVTRAEQRVTRWLFVTLAALAYTILVVVDPPVIESIAGTWFESLLVAVSYVSMITFVVTVVWYQRRLADSAEDALTEANERSERLLLNILPSDIAERLKTGESPIADRKPEVTVLFADIVGSTPITERLSANDLVATLDGLFSSFDDITNQYGLEKIKTVGDNYFAVAGLPSNSESHVQSAAETALAMRDELIHHHFPGIGQVHMRFGLHTGPVIAGVIGKHKFSYDVWGDTVNTASRMESTSEKDMIQVSQQVYNHLKGQYDLRSRGNITVKGKGDLPTYELVSRRTQPDS